MAKAVGTFAQIVALAPQHEALLRALRALAFALHPDLVEVSRPGDRAVSWGWGPKKLSEAYACALPYRDHVNLAFYRGAELCRQVNLDRLERAPKKVVVYLDPLEFKSTWLGNKAVYRTRMAIADDGELIVLAPGVREFGEDPTIDRLIRKFGYRGTPTTLEAVRREPELAANLSAAAHLIHGSSEGRFAITYCPGQLSRADIEGAGYGYADLGAMLDRYSPKRLQDGWNLLPGGQEIFYVSNPALGLWGVPARMGE